MSQHRRSAAIRRLFLSGALIAAITLLVGIGTGWASGEVGSSPTIGSDKPDYAAGDLVVLAGENWQPGESVQINVEDDEGKTWSREVWVIADEQGRIRDEFNLPDWFVATYRVTATGDFSGVATTTFTDGNVFVKNASTTPAGVTVGYRLERWNNDSSCPATAPSATANFTITGPEASSVSPLAGNSVGANNKDSVRVTFSSAPAGYAFDKWQSVAGAPGTNVGNDGAAPSTSTSFCINVTDSNISQTYVGFVKTTVTAPTAKAGADQTVNEGSSVNLDGSESTGATSYSWTQLTGPAVTLTGAGTATPSFTAADGPETLTFRLTATNAAGSSSDDVQVEIKNVKPTVKVSGPAAVNEGDSATYTYTATDPGADTLSVTETCGAAGTYAADPDPASYSCTFPDGPATSLVEVRANDGDEIGSGTLSVAIKNVKPTVKVSGPASANEGDSATYTYTATDPGADTLSVTETCGAAGTYAADPDPDSYSCTFPDGPATSLVEVRANDGDEIGSGTLSVEIKNVKPTVKVSGPASANEGDSATYTYTATDPGADTLSVTETCGAAGTYAADPDPASYSCTFPDGPATSLVEVRANDGDEIGSGTLSVEIKNVKPTVKVSGPAAVNEGDSATYTYTATDPGADTLSVTETCGAAGTYAADPDPDSYSCTFPDGPATSLVEVRANDGDEIGSGTLSVAIKNVKPTVKVSGPASANEGDSATYTYTATDPGADTLSVTETCGAAGTYAADPDPASYSCTFPDGPATSLVEVRANDGDEIGSGTLSVAIKNVKPTVKVSGPATANEGDSATYTYTATDPGADTLSVTETCGAAGTYAADPDPASYSCTFPDGPATSLVEVRANDGDEIGSGTLSVAIKNVKPTVKVSGPATANEGDSATYTYTATDPGADTLSVTETCGAAGTYAADPDPASYSCTFPDGPATSLVEVRANDGDEIGSGTLSVEIKNVKPTVKVSGPAAVNEGDSATYTYTATDPGADTLSVTETCGAAGTYAADPDPDSYSCTFPDGPATSLVEVRANDGDEIGSGTLSVAIANLKPTVKVSGPATANEGDSATYTYTATDPGADTLTITETCGAAGTYAADPDPASYSCTFPDGPATSLVEVRANDGDEIGSGTLSVAIANLKPSGDAGGPYSGTWGNPIEFTGTATDPAGSNDTLTFEWDFDYSGTFSADTTGASPSHTYAAPGSYTAALRVSDEDGGTDSIRTASVTVGKHPTSLTYGGDSSEQYSDFTDLKATLLDGSTPLAGKTITFTIGSQTTTATTNASGVATTTLQITQANDSYTVKASYAGDGLYDSASDSDPFTVTQENAGAFYTGDLFALTSSTSSSTATVVLSATIKDITALTGDPAYDPNAGEIPFAKVTFVDGAGKALSTGCSNLPVGLVSLADPKVGTVTCNWSANIGTQDSVQFTVGIKVEGRYIRYEGTDNTVVTVSKPIGTNFITGGGYLINQASAGQKAGGAGAKTNFGFNVKYNKSGTNLQGNINTIIRNAGRVYQIKGNSMTSLYVASSGVPSPTKPAKATFNGKANIQDITDPLETKAIDGNATLQVTMTDKGEPGSYDTIGITVWNKAGGLWFASRWDGTRTIEQLLGGGNLVAR